MKKGLIRDLLSVLFLIMTFVGPVFFGLCGFIFTGWYLVNFGLDGIQEAFTRKEYLQVVKYVIPLLCIKLFACGAGLIGLGMGWIPGYLGLLFLERNDPPPSLEAIYLPMQRRTAGLN
jgi:hypothetical protein